MRNWQKNSQPNAQLEQRVRRLRERQQGFLTKLEADIGKQQSAMRKLDEDLQKLRLANEQLRQSNHALRTANETGVADAELINKAMMEEIVSLHAARSADQAEAQVVITSLNVLLQKTASNGAGFEESPVMPEIQVNIGGRSFDVACAPGEESPLAEGRKKCSTLRPRF